MPKKTPLAIFTYNRPYHTQQTLQYLAKCPRLDECEIVIFCDGANRPEHQTQVEQVREAVSDWAKLHNAQVITRVENFGLKKSIETGVTDLCRKFGRIIVLEDDLLVNPAFIDYQLQALDHYADDERVWQVAGFTFPFDKSSEQGTMLLPLSTTWGWGTWQRAWKHYNSDPTEAVEYLAVSDNAYRFDLEGAYPYTQMLTGVAQNHLQSWGVLFWYMVWRHKGYVVYPCQSLVANLGFDDSGVNSGCHLNQWNSVTLNDHGDRAWRFAVTPDEDNYVRLRKYIEDFVARKKNSLFKRTFGKIQRLLAQVK